MPLRVLTACECDVTNKDMSCFMFQSYNNLNSHNTFLLIIGVFKGYLPHHKIKKKMFPTVICAISHGGLQVTILLLSFLIFTNTIIIKPLRFYRDLAELSNLITAKREYSD